MDAINLTGSSKTTKRRALDFYPTPPECTNALMEFLKLPACHIWEPACGEGHMVRAIEGFGHRVTATDIKKGPYSESLDFLESTIFCDAVITNPPFSLGAEFIGHAQKQAPIVAMLFKANYFHAQKRAKLFYDNPPAFILAMNWRPDFLFHTRFPGEKASPLMDTSWYVWIKGDNDTKYRVLSRGGISEQSPLTPKDMVKLSAMLSAEL